MRTQKPPVRRNVSEYVIVAAFTAIATLFATLQQSQRNCDARIDRQQTFYERQLREERAQRQLIERENYLYMKQQKDSFEARIQRIQDNLINNYRK